MRFDKSRFGVAVTIGVLGCDLQSVNQCIRLTFQMTYSRERKLCVVVCIETGPFSWEQRDA